MKYYLALEDVKKALTPNPTAVAEKLGIPKGSLSQYLSGKRILAAGHLKALAKEAETTVESLMALFTKQTEKVSEHISGESHRWRELFEWITADWPLDDLKKLATAATLADLYDYADMLNSVLRQRVQSKADADAECASDAISGKLKAVVDVHRVEAKKPKPEVPH